MPESTEILCFDGFELDGANRQLRHGGQPVELGSRYFDALALMVREAGTLVPKDRFMDEVWRGIPVTDEALTQCIRTLRRALGDDAASPRFIQTVPKHGYRFIAIPESQGPTGAAVPSGVARSGRRAGGLSGRIAGVATLAGGVAGALGGLFYGLLASTGGASTVFVLAALVGALGVLAGAGVGLGMASALAWRGRVDGMLVAGAALGGLAVGALGGTLGKDGIGLLTGAQLGQVTGPFEGLVLGAAVGGGAWLALTRRPDGPPVAAPLAALGLGASAGLFIHATGGRLLGGSLYVLQRDLGGTRLALDAIGRASGEPDFGRTAHLVTSTGEGALFVLAIVAGLMLVPRKR